MSTNSESPKDKSWVEAELEDSFDEELEMEIDDERIARDLRQFTDQEQQLRFLMRIHDPMKPWKLSPMDLQSRIRWEVYTKVKEEMLAKTNIPEAPWLIVEGNGKKRARLNCIHHLLQQVPYAEVSSEPVNLADRVFNPDYERAVLPEKLYVPQTY